ncbi:hypothetical protein [Spirosoma utsteinense]|uniref:Bacteriocin n=1 Tax=Spirosoma utsteinense TaxID=2585773 RepID=A0ABR6W607_9BACT|nr:hypothetical protein [Spirosoma utsteinense]MBC3788051.1 hypothetical protein [Spirosoma utsteinense]MBC3791245.1 hypothetical protein [Spirosoma utsteinense]
MAKLNLDQAEVSLLNEQELAGTEGGGTPWGELISNIGEVADTLAGFIDGLLGK